jgi:plasmid stabilization system protein ParE
LAEFPKAYPLVPRYEDSGVRRRVCGNYLIFYRTGVDSIDLLYVLHGAMDYEPLLFPEG